MKFKIHDAWWILALIFLGVLSVQGVRLSFGAFIQPWQLQYSTDRATISLLSTVSFIIYGVTQPLFGKLTERFGVRKVFALSALLVGIGIYLTAFATALYSSCTG